MVVVLNMDVTLFYKVISLSDWIWCYRNRDCFSSSQTLVANNESLMIPMMRYTPITILVMRYTAVMIHVMNLPPVMIHVMRHTPVVILVKRHTPSVILVMRHTFSNVYKHTNSYFEVSFHAILSGCCNYLTLLNKTFHQNDAFFLKFNKHQYSVSWIFLILPQLHRFSKFH